MDSNLLMREAVLLVGNSTILREKGFGIRVSGKEEFMP